MNTKVKLLIPCALMAFGALAENVPSEIKQQLYAVTNYWGKGIAVRTYQKERQKAIDLIRHYDDNSTVLSDWTESFLRYIMDNTPVDATWLPESGNEMWSASFAGPTRHSTNCWFIAADYVKRLSEMKKKAKAEFDQVLESNRFDISTESATQRIDKWNNLVAIERALGPSIFATTNSYPQWILHKLPAEEGATLYTNVLRRAGLVQ